MSRLQRPHPLPIVCKTTGFALGKLFSPRLETQPRAAGGWTAAPRVSTHSAGRTGRRRGWGCPSSPGKPACFNKKYTEEEKGDGTD